MQSIEDHPLCNPLGLQHPLCNQSSMQSIEDQPQRGCKGDMVLTNPLKGLVVNTGVAFKGVGPFKLSRAKFTCRSAA
jgi:hypothetical protein